MELSLPPMLRGQAVVAPQDAFATAIAAARDGTSPGLLVHGADGAELNAALVLAPESALEDAMAMTFTAALGFGDALGALGPPELAIHFLWHGEIHLNGASCGRLRAAASTDAPEAEPDWLVVGLSVPLMPPPGAVAEPGVTPDRTSLWEEGCGDISAARLLESWSRHWLVWINTWLDGGMASVHEHWRSRARGPGDDVAFDLPGRLVAGHFVGIDERGGMLLRTDAGTDLLPLTCLLEPA